jgi:hypothetical protein
LDRDLKIAKKPYSAPSFQILDTGAAKTELEAAGVSNDGNARQMLSVLKHELEEKLSVESSTLPSLLR